MRYSAVAGDRGTVTLDGAAVMDVIECDTAEGWVEFILKRNGRPVIKGDEIVTERLTGTVAFIPMRGPPRE